MAPGEIKLKNTESRIVVTKVKREGMEKGSVDSVSVFARFSGVVEISYRTPRMHSALLICMLNSEYGGTSNVTQQVECQPGVPKDPGSIPQESGSRGI